MNTSFFLLFVLIFLGYQKGAQDCVIIRSRQVDSGYSYKPQSKFKFENKFYQPYREITYRQDKLVTVLVYKSDGTIEYDLKDLLSDSKLAEVLNVPFRANVKIDEKFIFYNGSKFSIRLQHQDSIIAVKGKELIYYINKIK